MRLRIKLAFVLLLFSVSLLAQQFEKDSAFVRSIYDQALANGESYENLRYLCKGVGHRISGSVQADQAVLWGEKVLKQLKLDRVELQEIVVPFWERGEIEKAFIAEELNIELEITALGGSVGTNGILKANVVEVQGLEELADMDSTLLKGSIIFYNRPMDPKHISTFQAYGGCVDQRYAGASVASAYGAVGVLVRSMTLLEHDHHPHTGSMGYKDGVNKIPAAALSTESANLLHQYLEENERVEVNLELNCRTNPDKKSYNVIGELKGSEYPDQIMVIGGHLDSWDIGEGAHDDGAGIVHSIEVLRIFKDLDYRPKHTVRVVLFMNEENGNMGGKSYARIAKEKMENHIVALESDRGGFVPRGFSLKGNSIQLNHLQSFAEILKPYDLHQFEFGYAGVDINPLTDSANVVNPNIMMMGLVPDSQRYFDYHHAETDVFEAVNKRELELGCAAMTSLIYLLDQSMTNQN